MNAIAVIAQYAAHAAALHVSVHTGLPGVDFGGEQRLGRLHHCLRPLRHLLGPGFHPCVVVLPHEPEDAGLKFHAVFDGVTGAFDRIDIRGVNELRLKDAWADSPRTYLGMLAEGFPNMLMVLGPHTARGNIPQAIEHSVEFQAGILRFMREHDYTRVETRPEQVAEWTETVIKAAEPLLSSKVDSWQTGVNRNVEGRSVRRVLGYNGNGVHFRRKTDEVAKGGYKEFALR
jgi:hypothetical protein